MRSSVIIVCFAQLSKPIAVEFGVSLGITRRRFRPSPFKETLRAIVRARYPSRAQDRRNQGVAAEAYDCVESRACDIARMGSRSKDAMLRKTNFNSLHDLTRQHARKRAARRETRNVYQSVSRE